jgi:hypothetical protein
MDEGKSNRKPFSTAKNISEFVHGCISVVIGLNLVFK